MGAKKASELDHDRLLREAIEFVRMGGLLKRLDKSPHEGVGEAVFELGDEWDVRLFTTQASGEAVCYRLVVEPRGTESRGWTASLLMPFGGITSSLLRKIPLASVLEALDEARASEVNAVTPLAGAGGRLRGPARLSDDWIRVVAAFYVLGIIGTPRAPLQAAVNALGDGYSYKTVREHVQRARAEGFLAPTRQGQAQLELGPRWREVVQLMKDVLLSKIGTDDPHTKEADWLEAVFDVFLSASDQQAASELLRQFAKGIRKS